MPKKKVVSTPEGDKSKSDQSVDQDTKEKEIVPRPHINDEHAEAIAQFFEEHLIFYDLTNKDYKDRVKRAALLKEFGDQIGINPDRIWSRFTNMRTDFFKLKKRLKGKSGDGQIRMTALQKYKLERYSFLSTHYKGGDEIISTPCLGSVILNDDDHDEDDTESVFSDMYSREAHTSSSVATPGAEPPLKKANRKEGKKDLSEVLGQFLAESKRELQKTRESIAEASTSRHPTNERDAWVNWLGSLQREIPEEHWRQYQKETFDVAMRYLTPQQPTQQPFIQQQPQMIPFQPLLQSQMPFHPYQQQYPMMFKATPAQTTQPLQTEHLPIPPRVQSVPVTSTWESSLTPSSNLLGLAMTALSTPSGSFNIGDMAVDQTQQQTDVINTDEREAVPVQPTINRESDPAATHVQN